MAGGDLEAKLANTGNSSRRQFLTGAAAMALGAQPALSLSISQPAYANPQIKGKIAPELEELAETLWQYIIGYLNFDSSLVMPASRKLRTKYGFDRLERVRVPEDFNAILQDYKIFIVGYPNPNAHKLGFRLQEGYKLFNIHDRDIFDGFFVDGQKRDSVFGIPIGKYERFFLSDEIFSTDDYDFNLQGVNYDIGTDHKPRHVIGLTKKAWKRKEEVSMHEVAHILFTPEKTRNHRNIELAERIAYLVELGYKYDGPDIKNVKDAIIWLQDIKHTHSEYMQILINEFYKAVHGDSANQSAKATIRHSLVALSADFYNTAGSMPNLKVIPSANPRGASDQQALVMARLLHKEAMAEYKQAMAK